jgi:hypothetical protein
VGPAAFKMQLYQCMLGQALHMKGSMELHRATNQFGTMIWQLGEIWPTGGWGSLEYGNPDMPGQVRVAGADCCISLLCCCALMWLWCVFHER